MRASCSTAAAGLLLLSVSSTLGQHTNEASEAAITDPSVECQSYDYPPLDAVTGNFPTIWVNATSILPNDSAGKAKYASFSASIPNIAPKGTLTGNTNGLSYPASDPDCWWTDTLCTTPKLAGLKPDIVNVPEPRTLGYGFDDGPFCGHNAFYDFLSSQKQKATMFYIGSNVMDNPLEAQRAVADGHEICVHTWSHPYMTATTNEGAFAELWYTMQAIKFVTGVTPTCFRPPFGDVDDRIRFIAAQLGLETIIWKYDSDDWAAGYNGVTAADVQTNYDNFIGNATAGAFNTVGAIILTHELNNFTMQTAIDNYPKLAKAFDHIVPIAVAQNKTQPYVETNYTMPSFAQYIGGTTVTNGSSPSGSALSSTPSHTTSGASAPSSSASVKPQDTAGKSGARTLLVPVPLVLLASLLALFS
ncbi:carbohydrate esterase family 4 protein [Mycena galericulata]|nr:carbohydrate esterase family 4 protein [Mycena galericulata]